MPNILRWNGDRFHFFSNESDDPPNIHVTRAVNTAKLWPADGSLAYNNVFKHNKIRGRDLCITSRFVIPRISASGARKKLYNLSQ